MRLKTLIVAVTAFMIAFFVPSCAPDRAGISRAFADRANDDAGFGVVTSQEVPLLDASASSREDTSSIPTNEGERDAASTEANDASIVEDRPAPPAEDVPWIDPRYRDPQAFLLPPTTCSGQRLSMPTAGLELATHGYTLWHLCYKTPGTRTSDNPIARLRANEVVVSVMRRGDAIDLLHASAPTVANPWTVSALVALPSDYPPLFTIMNQYQAGQQLPNATSFADGTFPNIHGELRAWLVDGNGSQILTAMNRACRDPFDPEEYPVSLLPASACAGYERSCPSLTGMACLSF